MIITKYKNFETFKELAIYLKANNIDDVNIQFQKEDGRIVQRKLTLVDIVEMLHLEEVE